MPDKATLASLVGFFGTLAGTAGTLAAAWFIWKQAKLLRTQNQLQTLTQLYAAWDSARIRTLRSRWAEDELRSSRLAEDDRDLDSLELILEFLEEFAGLRVRGVLDDRLVWDTTIGWHAVRYFFYNDANGNIGRLRAKWLDRTLYQNLGVLWDTYRRVETNERGINEQELIKQVEETKPKFLAAEHNAYQSSHGSD